MLEEQKPIVNIFDEGIVYKVEMGSIGTEKRARTGAVDVKAKMPGQDPDKDVVGVDVKLFEGCKELQDIFDLQAEVRRYLTVRSTPSVLQRGAYLLHKDYFLEVRAKIKEFQAKLSELVDKFVQVYPQVQETAKGRLKALWNPAHFPPVEELKARFYLKARVLEVGVPGRLKELYGQAVLDEELANLKDEYRTATEEIMMGLRQQFAQMLTRMREIVKGDGTGKAAYFKNTAVTNFKEFLEFFDPKNIAGDAELKDLVDKCTLVMSGVDPEDIRGSKAMRKDLQSVFDEVANVLPTLVGEKSARRVLG
jgi:hypothetical protein